MNTHRYSSCCPRPSVLTKLPSRVLACAVHFLVKEKPSSFLITRKPWGRPPCQKTPRQHLRRSAYVGRQPALGVATLPQSAFSFRSRLIATLTPRAGWAPWGPGPRAPPGRKNGSLIPLVARVSGLELRLDAAHRRPPRYPLRNASSTTINQAQQHGTPSTTHSMRLSCQAWDQRVGHTGGFCGIKDATNYSQDFTKAKPELQHAMK